MNRAARSGLQRAIIGGQTLSSSRKYNFAAPLPSSSFEKMLRRSFTTSYRPPSARQTTRSQSSNSRPVQSQGPATGHLTLYQYAICPFCCKTKAVLSYVGYSFDTVEVNPLTKSSLKKIRHLGDTDEDRKYGKVPIAVFQCSGDEGERRVNGSDSILSNVLSEVLSTPTAKTGLPSNFASPESMKWLDWSDTFLAVRFVRHCVVFFCLFLFRTWDSLRGSVH